MPPEKKFDLGDYIEAFWAKVDVSGDCWLWTASRVSKGYGAMWAGRAVLAHRYAYELLIGPIPDGLTLDHLCRNRTCVNPAHLEPVTRGENVLRGVGLTARNVRKTSCPKGHPYDEANTLRFRRSRHCRTCMRASHRRWLADQRTAADA